MKKTLSTVDSVERLADGPVALQDADQAVGNARLLEGLPDPLAEQRRQLRRLEDDAVAGHQGDRDLAERNRPRVVPRGDHGDDAERLEADLRLLAEEQSLAHPDLLVVEDRRALGGDPVEGVDRRHHLHRVGLGDRLALLGGQQPGDLLGIAGEDLGGPLEVASAVLQRELAPERLHLGDVVDGALDVGRLDRRHRSDQLAGRGVERIQAAHLSAG